MAQFEAIATTYQLRTYAYHLSPLVDGQTDAALTYAGPVAAILPTMPYKGSVVGIGVDASAAAGTGVSTFDAVIATVQQNIDLSLAAAATRAFSSYPEGTYKFAAGDTLGASYTSGTLTTNANVTVYVTVMFEGVRP